MLILGISAYYHDSAACLIRDGHIIAAAQEERFTRIKHDASFPQNAIQFCLDFAQAHSEDLAYVAFYDKPFLKFERILETYLAFAPKGYLSFIKAIPLWLKQKIWIKESIRNKIAGSYDILFSSHHESHAASAFYPSPFKEAAILTMDGVGEWQTTTLGHGCDNCITLQREINFPHSLGLLYSAFTYYAGFKVNSGEYKLMGLAPYGKPVYEKIIRQELIDIKEDGSFRLNMRYFNYCQGLTMTNKHFHKLFGLQPRKPESILTQKHMDLARSIQEVTQEVMCRMARHVYQFTGMKNLCMAGGVALNCVGNGHILRNTSFENVWIQPASTDAGGALGSALIVWYQHKNNPRITVPSSQKDQQGGSLLGPKYSDASIRQWLESQGASFQHLERDDLLRKVSGFLAEGAVVGWFRGRMEFGPRALGARSILGDPRSKTMQSIMNLKIKFRESFRPFAPSVLKEKCANYFDLDKESPYMLLVAPVRESLRPVLDPNDEHRIGFDRLNIALSDIPAVTHVDYSARIQTVDREDHPDYYDLIKNFEERTGCAMLINTSFNVRGEPIVCSPEDAFQCFMKTGIDYLVLENFLLVKKDQPHFLHQENPERSHELD